VGRLQAACWQRTVRQILWVADFRSSLW
jgi:hypothetical protein